MPRQDEHAEAAATGHAETLQRLVGHIRRAGLDEPVSIALDVLRPLDFLSSQVALFVVPFSRGSSWEPYNAALTDETSWRALRHLLDEHTQTGAGREGD